MLRDLEFIYQQIIENHPGIYNKEDPNFTQFLEEQYFLYRPLIHQAQSIEEQKCLLDRFTKSFDDGHLGIEWNEKIKEKSQKPVAFSIQHLTPMIVWVQIPTFNLTEAQKIAFDKMLIELKTFHNKAKIIFDLRGNQGGNSYYGRKIMHTLFGKEYTEYQTLKLVKDCYVDWRASAGNLHHLKQLHQKYNVKWLKTIITGIENNIRLNNPYYRKYFDYAPHFHQFDLNHNMHAHIMAIIDNKNASAVLDFLDDLKAIDHPVTLIGEETRGDRLYMELRSSALPSKLGKFGFPIKVYRNRYRGDNESYMPDILYDGDIANTARLQSFILDEICLPQSMAS